MTVREQYEYILRQEGVGIEILFLDIDGSCAYVGEDIIELRQADRDYPDTESIFTMLHEIGHIRTNTPDMMRVDMEYLATKFAIEKSKYYGVRIPGRRKIEYQRYIDDWIKKDSKKYKVNLHPGKYMLVW